MRFFYRARQTLGMSCMVCGTGFAFKMEVLEPDGWNTRTVTEDCEFSVQQITAGRTIAFVDRAVFYDEQPSGFATSLRQRYRWVVGAAQATRWCMKDVGRGIRARHKGSVDMLCYLLAVPATLLLMLQGPLLLLAALLQPLSPLPILWGDIDGDRCLPIPWPRWLRCCACTWKEKSVRRLWKPILLFSVVHAADGLHGCGGGHSSPGRLEADRASAGVDN